ncbi:Thiol-disulfide interchange protein, contains DsbC and DsbD domains [Faunimonas pinastri]|uniref:Thiol-disulfide interchange protein, contains DsbC and DsbD domains n=1 Tax=Faunimonas pinastri TaxID=1855383 RepID=A0A1H8ZPI2_9HYPH|nr:protein-disulfide reductase DsbD domain-containing protein [Faunimonas pinastri]SEP66133.1 Thiol-disulfide interchange protein, contains DsbC and DsbD domains [Faunimonas pinastri]
MIARVLAFLIAAGSVTAAHAARSQWVRIDNAQMRLLVASPRTNEAGPASPETGIDGGIDIALESGWHTYWRFPGDAGMAPEFDFSGSKNVASVEVLYPTPERHTDGDSVSLIYEDEVVFPLRIKPADPARPVTLRVNAFFGVCADTCLPVRASASVDGGPGQPADPLTDSLLSTYVARLPGLPDKNGLSVMTAKVEGDAIAFQARVPPTADGGGGEAELMCEPPASLPLGQPGPARKQGSEVRFQLALPEGNPASAVEGQSFRCILSGGGRAVEQQVTVE